MSVLTLILVHAYFSLTHRDFRAPLIPDEAASYLCSMFMEEGAIFAEVLPERGPPVIHGEGLFVEGVRVCDPTSSSKAAQLLSWGASFSVYAQKLTARKFENVACVLTRFVLGTDSNKLPKKLEKVAKKLLKGE